MNKTPIAIALERQIPEYVRGEYELFVNFIKAYYEFLNQTQQRNLEDVRSIENTLDEFVIRFKKELSVLFPTNSVENERFILQRIREFYQSRGSKESFQFLFRILFNKDSDIFYPSTQILRASDGKWVQEKSIFVKSESGNLFNLSGKIINIQTSNKEIHVFCPRVVYYRDDIYEVFIDRAYVQDISISDKVMSSDGLDTGHILPCPNKYTITSSGAGFEIGQLYYLKTESGDGSLIKITKIGTGGSIKKVQVISFGLDYNSTYYAKLSNKQAVAVPYRHPVPGPYPDGINGFVDYGYINRQDYFYFDKFYTPSVENNQNVFYADGTYVGEIVGSFYTNATNTNVIDSDTAEIKIDLGSVAIYPGYYSASDGFISDESYIQDGKYYQLFSYVIKVEQQIQSYYDIVKELLHPAGLELYAEYTIKNDYLVSASPLLAFIRRQFLEQEYVTDDEGTNLVGKNVESSDSIAPALHTFLQDIKDVNLSIQKYRSDGTLAGETDQRRWSTVDPTTFTFYDDYKVIPTSDSISTTSVFRYNDVFQLKIDAIDQPLDSITNKDVTQLKQDTQIADSEIAVKNWFISSIEDGTFYQTTSAIHSDLNDIKNLVRPDIADQVPQLDVLDRTVVYDRSQIPLVSLDPAQPIDVYASLYTPETKADLYSAVGGEWSWNGSTYNLINPEVRIGVAYSRSPDILLSGVITAGSNVVTLTSGSTDGILPGRIIVKNSGTGDIDVGTVRVTDVTSALTFRMTSNAINGGTIIFTLIGDTPDLAQSLSSPTDSFPNGSIQGVVKFSFSGGSWDKTVPTLDVFDRTVNYFRTLAETPIASDPFPDGSVQGVAKFSFSGGSWSDTLNSPVDSTPVRTWDKGISDSINNTNTGLLYYNAYNQNDALDPNSSYSYEASDYSVHDTRAIS